MERKSSGTIFSNVGPIQEMYDHSNTEKTCYGLMGFLNGIYLALSKEERINSIMKELKKHHGEKATEYIIQFSF